MILMQDAIRDKKTRFNFMGEEIALVSTVGIFITMNPGKIENIYNMHMNS